MEWFAKTKAQFQAGIILLNANLTYYLLANIDPQNTFLREPGMSKVTRQSHQNVTLITYTSIFIFESGRAGATNTVLMFEPL